MERQHGRAKYASATLGSVENGCAGQELWKECDGTKRVVAKLVFWDAEGQFVLETMGEVPLTIIEELIAETRQVIRVR